MATARRTPPLAALLVVCLPLATCAATLDDTSRQQTPALDGTSWRLVQFESSDDTALTPDDRSKYTLRFEKDGRLHARIDCNRGSSTWKATGDGQLSLGPLATTRAQCPEGSMHDHIVKQWPYIRSYVIRGGHLFLALMADGGIYEFEPLPSPKR